MNLKLEVVGSDEAFDRVGADADGVLTYETGEGEPVMQQLKHLTGLDGPALLATAAGWSNGYVRLVEDTVS